MSDPLLPKILVIDDEEAILETMTFTFRDDYQVFTSSDPRRALEVLDEQAPVAAVLTDQRMPNMSGVELVTEVCKRHPETVRMILTGFSDMDAIIKAINDGHVYAYITKPWEPDQLKQVMKQAVEHYQLTVENKRLLQDLQRANVFLAAVMDQLDTGALAVDAAGVIQALNRPVRDYLALEGDVRGQAPVVGIDRARPDAAHRGPVHFVRADLHQLPLAAQAFDLVLSFQVIEHLEDPVPYLSAIADVLAPCAPPARRGARRRW